MNITNWKIFDKLGSPINWYVDSHINLSFVSSTGKNASGYLITDISGNIVESKITNSGFYYNSDTSVFYTDIYNNTPIDITSNVTVNYIDVSIFTTTPQNVKGIGSITNIDISTLFDYPSSIYSSAIFLKPVSQGIVETEHLFILEDIDGSLFRPYDASITNLVIEMEGEDSEIQLFEVDEDNNTVIWSDSLIYDVSIIQQNSPITVNVGFKADSEGVFERKLRIYSVVNDEYYTLGEIVVNAESIGEDERFRTLLGNFGLPDPKDFPTLFKEADINEDLPDYELINSKSKQMILDHNQIIPYIGTYKSLVNAIKWLGYDDIYIREWFKNVKQNKKISLVIPYDAKERSKTLLSFSSDERKVLKKLNQLSLNYCITTETGEYDEYDTPETKNCYEYNLNEVFVKLLSLKDWLEKNIIGVNARIIDITGEGVYYDTFINQIYATDNVGYTYAQTQSLSPISYPTNSELTLGEASINLSLLEYSQTKLSDLKFTFADFIDYVWNPLDPSTTLSPEDPSYLANPENYMPVGPSLSAPFMAINDVQWKLSIENTKSGVLGEKYVTNPLWIYDNEIKYYNILDSSSIFYDSSTDLTIILEKAYIKDPSNDIWEESTHYSIYPDTFIRIEEYTWQSIITPGEYSITSGTGEIWLNNDILNYPTSSGYPYTFTVTEDASIYATSFTKITSPYRYGYVMESSLGEVYIFNNYVNFFPGTNPKFEYSLKSVYNVPMLQMTNFVTYDEDDNEISLQTDKVYYLDILDGKIFMDDASAKEAHYVNFNYDTSLYEQKITLNVEYVSPRLPLQVIDPSIYYWADPSGLSGGTSTNFILEDNSIYTMKVNHIGDYKIEVFGFDGYNTIFTNSAKIDHNVWIKHPTIYTLVNSSDNLSYLYPQTKYLTISELNNLINNNKKPLYDRQIPLQGLSILLDSNNNPYINVPSITHFQDVPQPGSLSKFYNLSERVVSIDGPNSLTIDPDYQLFFNNDNINLVLFNKEDFIIISEVSSNITSKLGNQINVSNLPVEYKIDSLTGVYILNDTIRTASNFNKLGSDKFSLDISMNGYSYNLNQKIAIIITDNITGYQWGSTFTVIEEPIGSTHVFNYMLPDFVISNPSRYKLQAKYAFSSYTTFTEEVDYAIEENNDFLVHLVDNYRQYFIDDTFVMINILFDHDYVDGQWYKSTDNLITNSYYYYDKPISVDANSLVVIQSKYHASDYMLNQKNTWTIKENASGKLILKVYNDVVPFIYDKSGYYDVINESYDKFGNLVTTIYEGLIKIK